MTATARPLPALAPPRRVVPETILRESDRQAQFRRRRTVAAVSVAALLAGGSALGALGGVSLGPPEPAPAAGAVPIASRSYVVQPGDTLWRIGRRIQPAGDVRPLVQRLAAGRGGAPLRAGERLVLPLH